MFSASPTHDRTPEVNQDWEARLPDSAAAVTDSLTSRGLEDEVAQAWWREFISASEDRLFLLPPEAWPARILTSPIFTEWRAMWRQDPGRAFDDWLREALPWAESTPVFFTWSVSQSIETTWGAFRLGWRHFMLEAEDAVVWSRQEPLALRFLPTGLVYLGGRPWPESPEFAGS